MKKHGFIFIFLLLAFELKSQQVNCTFKPSQYTIHFGSGNVRDPNNAVLTNYQRVYGSCPTDGHFSFAPFTSGCFNDDWHTLTTDHTNGDNDGNMLLVNAAPYGGVFLNTSVTGLKSNTMYELGLWVMNLCRPTNKCPSVLLPSLNIRLETADGRIIASIVTSGLSRVPEPVWSQHLAYFTTPASPSNLRLIMADNAPGGCGNDFALDDITFRECIKINQQPVVVQKKQTIAKRITTSKPVKNVATAPQKKVQTTPVMQPKPVIISSTIEHKKQSPQIIAPPPLILKTRENALVRKIETEAGEIRINCYDNGDIDGDTVSIYHNNKLIKSHMRLSDKPISFTIAINDSQPHHELIMVAENLGSIPPNTSVMTIYTPGNRYEVFISSTKQKNARVEFDLKR